MAEPSAICADCGATVLPGRSVCGACGNRIEWPLTAPTPPVGSSPPDRPPPPPPPPEPVTVSVPGAGGLLPALTVDLVVSSPNGERPVQLDSGDELEIGREVGPLTDLCTDNVSGRHARLLVGDDEVVVEDVGSDGRGSTNGTYVDGARLAPNRPTPVPDGAVVTCGIRPPLTIRVRVTRL